MRNSLVRAAVAAALALVALTGCSNNNDTSGSSDSSSSARPEDQRTDAAAVAKGLTGIKDLVAKIAAASADQGKTLSDGIEPLWAPVEGTVQENSQETYDALEAAFTKLESGDATQAQEGAREATDAIDAYLADFPG
ncbi:MAG: hypothetical protein R2731_05730 [Nocardioides sp.]